MAASWRLHGGRMAVTWRLHVGAPEVGEEAEQQEGDPGGEAAVEGRKEGLPRLELLDGVGLEKVVEGAQRRDQGAAFVQPAVLVEHMLDESLQVIDERHVGPKGIEDRTNAREGRLVEADTCRREWGV